MCLLNYRGWNDKIKFKVGIMIYPPPKDGDVHWEIKKPSGETITRWLISITSSPYSYYLPPPTLSITPKISTLFAPKLTALPFLLPQLTSSSSYSNYNYLPTLCLLPSYFLPTTFVLPSYSLSTPFLLPFYSFPIPFLLPLHCHICMESPLKLRLQLSWYLYIHV